MKIFKNYVHHDPLTRPHAGIESTTGYKMGSNNNNNNNNNQNEMKNNQTNTNNDKSSNNK